MRFLLIALFLLGATAQAKPARRPASIETIFQCTTRSEKYEGRFILKSDGDFALTGKKSGVVFSCKLELSELSYNSSAHVPNLTIRMSPNECRHLDENLITDRTLLKNMTLIANPRDRGRPSAIVQWVTYLQPSDCVIQKYNREALLKASNAQP